MRISISSAPLLALIPLLSQSASGFVPSLKPSVASSTGSLTGTAAKKKSSDDASAAAASDAENPAKKAALDGVLSQIERNYGRGSVVRLGDDPASLQIETISSGALTLDAALGGSRHPGGRLDVDHRGLLGR